LLEELDAFRQRVGNLEAFETERKSIATELRGTRQRLQYLLAVSPAIIYTTKASGDYGCTFVSENLRAIMGYTPETMTTDPKGWPDHLHADDASRVLNEMARSASTAPTGAAPPSAARSRSCRSSA
jgi:PAS domain-containing protein